MGQPYVVIGPESNNPSDEWLRLGAVAQLEGKPERLAEAERYYGQALRLNPNDAISTQNLAVLYAQMGKVNEALLAIERATILDGDKHAVMHVNRALMTLEAGRIDEALAAARRATEIAPNENQVLLALALIVSTAGLPAEAIPLYNKILDTEPEHGMAGPNACFVQTLTTAAPPALLAQRKRWYDANRFSGVKARTHRPDASKPLRVGYVGGDFKRHSASMIFGNVVLNHSDAIETYLYSSLPVNASLDGMTKRFMDKAGGRWRDITDLTDEQADAQIRHDRIDILVDLAGHTGGGRLKLFTRKPAPIQVTAWGFAHGTGVPEIDYFFADPVAVPPEEREHYAEKIWDLPSIVTYLEPTEYKLKGTSPMPYHSNECITFGAFARYEKMNNECLEMYAQVLERVPGSRLILKDSAYQRPYSIRRVLRIMKGIDQSRLLFSIGTNHTEHMQSYQQADLLLDPYPHSGGVVCMEQIYMGLPIVTLYGTQASGRTTSSVLTAMGRTDWIARSPKEYIDKAVAMANDVPALQKARKTLRQELLDSPVVKGYCSAAERAYLEMVKAYDHD